MKSHQVFRPSVFILSLLSFLTIFSCNDTSNTPPSNEMTDGKLLDLINSTTTWTRYKFSPDTLLRSFGSGHSEPRLVVRYNAKAATQLDANGKVKSNPSFPDSSLIVKDLITGGQLSLTAVMMKLPSSQNNGAGWLWSEIEPNGTPRFSITSRGSGCIACHSAGTDYTRMNDSHP
jgi:hypothetical protein